MPFKYQSSEGPLSGFAGLAEKLPQLYGQYVQTQQAQQLMDYRTQLMGLKQGMQEAELGKMQREQAATEKTEAGKEAFRTGYGKLLGGLEEGGFLSSQQILGLGLETDVGEKFYKPMYEQAQTREKYQRGMQAIETLPPELQARAKFMLESGLTFPEVTPEKGFTLGPDQERYTAGGELIASGPPKEVKPMKTQYTKDIGFWRTTLEGDVEVKKDGVWVPGGFNIVDGAPGEKSPIAQQEQMAGTQALERSINRLQEGIPSLLTGTPGVFMSQIFKGGEAAGLDADLTTIRSQNSKRVLEDMRAQSKTGGAVGQVTEREWAYLASTLGNISLEQPPEQLLANLERMAAIRHHYINGPVYDGMLWTNPQTKEPWKLGDKFRGMEYLGGHPQNDPQAWRRLP